MMLRNHLIPAALALILVFVSLGAIQQVRSWWRQVTPAIDWHGVEVFTRTVHPGGTLSLEYTATINKQCPADLRGFLVAPDGTVPVRFPVVAGGYSKPTPEPVKIRVSLTIPYLADPGLSPMVAGDYTYRTMAIRYCPEGVEEDASIPDAPFRLEVP